MITDYKVLYGGEPDDLEEEVKQSIADGFEPLAGGFFVTTYTYKNRDGEKESGENFYQVVVKKQTEE